MASHPSQIPAGGRDKISVVVNTKNRGGQNLFKRFTVFTDDPRNSRVELSVSGKVNGYMVVDPRALLLMGNPGEPLSATVRIIPQPEFPFKITSVQIQGEELSHILKPLGQHPERDGYELIVASSRREPGSTKAFVQLQTDLESKPTINIPVSIRVLGSGGKPVNPPE